MSEVILVSESVSMPAGLKAVKDLIVDIVKKFHEGKSAAEVAAAELPALMAAIAVARELPDDIKAAQMPIAVGLLAGQVAAALLAPPVAAPAAPAA